MHASVAIPNNKPTVGYTLCRPQKKVLHFIHHQHRATSSTDAPLDQSNDETNGTRCNDDGSHEAPAVGWLWQTKRTAAQHNVGGMNAGQKKRTDHASSFPSSITRQSLREQNIRPKKSLGQNFMIDHDVLKSITKAAHLSYSSPVIEIGPGTGALTQQLIDSGACIIAVEKDYGLFDRLVEEYSNKEFYGSRLKFVCGDVLKQDLGALLDEVQHMSLAENEKRLTMANDVEVSNKTPVMMEAHRKPQVVANLPYYITKDFLNQSLPLGHKASSLVLMLQDEVANRLTRNIPGSSTWRAMNIIVDYFSNPTYLFRIDKRKYVPSPKVDGAVVEFALKAPEDRVPVPNEKIFLTLVKKAFLQRRKVMRNSLQPLVSADLASEALNSAGLSVDARAQDTSLDDFVKLSWSIDKLLSV